MVCAACNKTTNDKNNKEDTANTVSCSKCPNTYHALCLNLNRDDFRALRSKQKQFVCPSCKLKTKTIRTDSTPIRSKPQLSDQEQTDCAFVSAAQVLTEEEFPAEAMKSFSKALGDLQAVFKSMKNEMSEFTRALNAITGDISDFRRELNEMKSQIKEMDKYKNEVIGLRAEIAELRQSMATNEQRRFLKDVEITGITENKGENLPHLVSVISSTLGVDLDSRDVDDIRRVGPRISNAAERPRPIIVTMARRAPRDQILRAARSRRGLTTDKLNISGNPRQVYLNEHLTKENRVLFSKARRLGNDLHFKFVWSSNGNIFMRRSETSSVLHVTSVSVLERLSAQNCSQTVSTESKICS